MMYNQLPPISRKAMMHLNDGGDTSGESGGTWRDKAIESLTEGRGIIGSIIGPTEIEIAEEAERLKRAHDAAQAEAEAAAAAEAEEQAVLDANMDAYSEQSSGMTSDAARAGAAPPADLSQGQAGAYTEQNQTFGPDAARAGEIPNPAAHATATETGPAPASKEDVDSSLSPEQQDTLGKKAMDLFGIDGQDIGRFLLYYMGGRLSGGSHAGSMQWAGKAVIGEMQKKDALRLKKQEKKQLVIDEYLKLARKLKGSGAVKSDEAYKELVNAINSGDTVTIEEAFANPEYFTQKHNLGLKDEDIVEVYRPGYARPISGWKTEGGFYVDPDGDGNYELVPLSAGFREYSSDQDHVKDVSQLVKSLIGEDDFKVTIGEGDDRKTVGLSREQVTSVITNFASQQTKLGRPDDPRVMITAAQNAVDFMKANNIPITRQSLESVLWAQATAGAEMVDVNKLTTVVDDKVVYIPNHKIKGISNDLIDFTKDIENEDASTFLRDADLGWDKSKDSFDPKAAANGDYGEVDPKWKKKILNAPSPYWSYVYWMMATEGNEQ